MKIIHISQYIKSGQWSMPLICFSLEFTIIECDYIRTTTNELHDFLTLHTFDESGWELYFPHLPIT